MSTNELSTFCLFLAQNVEGNDRDLGHGQGLREVVKEVNKCKEVAEEDKG